MNAYFLFGFENLFGEVRLRIISDQVEKSGALIKHDSKPFRDPEWILWNLRNLKDFLKRPKITKSFWLPKYYFQSNTFYFIIFQTYLFRFWLGTVHKYTFYIEFWVRSSFECENFQAKTQNVLKCNCTIYDMAMGIRWKIQNRLTVVEESNHNIFGSHYYSQNCRMWLTREKYILTFIDAWKKIHASVKSALLKSISLASRSIQCFSDDRKLLAFKL